MACSDPILVSSDTDVNSDDETGTDNNSANNCRGVQNFYRVTLAHGISDTSSDSVSSLPEVNLGLQSPLPLEYRINKNIDKCVVKKSPLLSTSENKRTVLDLNSSDSDDSLPDINLHTKQRSPSIPQINNVDYRLDNKSIAFSLLQNERPLPDLDSSCASDCLPEVNLHLKPQSSFGSRANKSADKKYNLFSKATNKKKLLNLEDINNNKHVIEEPRPALSDSQSTESISQGSASSSVNSSDKLTIILEKSLSEEKFFKELVFLLEAADVAQTTENLPLKGSIFWKSSSGSTLIENQILLFIGCSKLVQMVDNFKRSTAGDDTLLALVQRALGIYDNSKITIVTIGMRKYFQSNKSKATREFREIVSSQSQSQQPKKRTNREQTPHINKVDLDEAVIDLQLQANVNLRLLENALELSEMLASLTKAITEAPRKRAKHGHGFSWHMHADSSDTVKVDKNMTNLYKLWMEQLMQFHQVSKDTALAIVAKYPSPQSLLRAYRKCLSEDEAANLLANIEVRRGNGPLATTRRVGPELSFKVHTLLTTDDPNEILHTV